MKKSKISSKLLLIISLFNFLIIQSGCFNFNETSKSPLKIELEQKRNTVINFVISNTGDSGLYFLNIDTPMEGHMRQYFRITNENDEVVPYIGILASVDLGSASWTKLGPGEKKEFEVDLQNQYDFSSVIGSYNINFVFPVNIRKDHRSHGRSNFSDEKIDIESNKIDVEIQNTNNQDLMESERADSCTAYNLPHLNTAKNLGKAMTQSAIAYLNTNKMDDLYNKYWGADNNNRYKKILNNYKKILPSYQKNWSFACPTECPVSTWLAYVQKDEPYKVNICKKFFWKTNAQERGMIMLHESSHWNVTVGTDDHAYQEAIFNLAPNIAIKNADTYAQFGFATHYDASNTGNTTSNCNAENKDWIGDGYCDDYDSYNTAACNYDGGDCCSQSCKPGGGGNCSGSFNCKDPIYQNNNTGSNGTTNGGTSSNCNVPNQGYVGDGYCDGSAPYNTAACNYDGGDCCPQSCSGSHCGIWGYTCLDPNY